MPRITILGTGSLLALLVSLTALRADSPASALAQPPSFLNDVEPIFTRLGCNQGACHGKNAGQNGFRLSLRGYAPEMDYLWLTREFNGRRISLAVPEDSLLLRKPLGLASHEGGKLFKADGPEYGGEGSKNANHKRPVRRFGGCWT